MRYAVNRVNTFSDIKIRTFLFGQEVPKRVKKVVKYKKVGENTRCEKYRIRLYHTALIQIQDDQMTSSSFNKEEPVGIIGLGIMGSSFASNLLSRGYNVHVYNRTKEKAKPLVDRGATFHSTPKELALASDIIMTSLTDQKLLTAWPSETMDF